MQIGSHQVQVIITVTLLVATSIAALLCDYLRFRMQRSTAPARKSSEPVKVSIAPTLVPEIQLAEASPVPHSNRTSRLAAALKQPRRVISPEVQAIIARSSQFEESPAAPKKPTTLQKKTKARRAS